MLFMWVFGMLSKGLEPVFHGAEGKGTSAKRRIILRRRRSRSIPRGTLILFSSLAILLRSRGTPRLETRSWNVYSSRQIFRTMPSSASRRTRVLPISVDSDFQFLAGTRGTRRILLFQSQWPDCAGIKNARIH